MNKLLCSIFGHRPAFGYGRQEGKGYFHQRMVTTDGMGRVHIELFCYCERCGKRYHVGMIHWLTKEELNK